MLKINKESYTLLRKCLMRKNQHLIWVLDTPDNVSDSDVLNQVREAIGDELIEYGLNDSEPNDYGMQLEKLIDIVGGLFLIKHE